MVSPRSVSSSSNSTTVSRDTFSMQSRRSSVSSHTSCASSGFRKSPVLSENTRTIPSLLFEEGQLSHRRRLRTKSGIISSSNFSDKENIPNASPTPLPRQTSKLPEGVWYCQVPPRPAFFPYHNNSVFLPTGRGQELAPQLSTLASQDNSENFTFSEKPARKIRRRSYSGSQLKSPEILSKASPCSYVSCHSNDSRTSLPGALTQDKVNLLRKIRQIITNKKKSSLSKKKPLSNALVAEIQISPHVSRGKKRRSIGEPLIAGPEYSKINAC
ncbi:hypothetical protein K493DRAFT_320906 [Basidiobolus meristosporus CBS 931.73]|uniref:Uncharacterized protein n=1 Tax=Basidiobolus meristosporus CBS 931.73 TaxID=1314790 RepID=A0A1Y1X4S2_9FUNG|nr:hypothetical protein K493DRAFT_320906 [Basidiobolus meristosporus CBS 931.73]|eukprot:ORX80356.1 hypothetical protein K493DRAFT_320906 [Basidiobolus meristosporus CBS 931.73]